MIAVKMHQKSMMSMTSQAWVKQINSCNKNTTTTQNTETNLNGKFNKRKFKENTFKKSQNTHNL